jgi:hypothetical protein
VKGSLVSGFLGNASEDHNRNCFSNYYFMAMQIGMLLGCLVLALLIREASENIGNSSSIFDKLAGRRFGK